MLKNCKRHLYHAAVAVLTLASVGIGAMAIEKVAEGACTISFADLLNPTCIVATFNSGTGLDHFAVSEGTPYNGKYPFIAANSWEREEAWLMPILRDNSDYDGIKNSDPEPTRSPTSVMVDEDDGPEGQFYEDVPVAIAGALDLSEDGGLPQGTYFLSAYDAYEQECNGGRAYYIKPSSGSCP